MLMSDPHYLGDSVYICVEHSGMLELCTNNGVGKQNIIYLEPEVEAALLRYLTSRKESRVANL